MLPFFDWLLKCAATPCLDWCCSGIAYCSVCPSIYIHWIVLLLLALLVLVCCREERKKWINAKYVDHVFSIPPSLELDRHELVRKASLVGSSDDDIGKPFLSNFHLGYSCHHGTFMLSMRWLAYYHYAVFLISDHVFRGNDQLYDGTFTDSPAL